MEQLALWDAMRCSEALPGDAGWVVDWQAVVDHVRDDAMMGLREKGASSLRHQWQREGLGPGGRAALRVALSRLPPHVMSAPTMRRQGDNTPSNALCALYDASASVFTKNSARLRTLRHVPQASSVVDLSTPTVGEDVVFIAGHSASCDGGGLSPGSGSGVYQRGTLAGWPHVCGCASVVPPGGGAAIVARRVHVASDIGDDVHARRAARLLVRRHLPLGRHGLAVLAGGVRSEKSV